MLFIVRIIRSKQIHSEQIAELFNINAGDTYNYHCVLRVIVRKSPIQTTPQRQGPVS
jgi:hypothetical protein